MLHGDEQDRMVADLLMSELIAKSAAQVTILRARLYVSEGLPLERVLTALNISRPTYYRRIRDALRQDTLLHTGEALAAVRQVNLLAHN